MGERQHQELLIEKKKELLIVLLLFHDPTYKQRMLTLWELLWRNCLLLSSVSNATHKTLTSSLSWTTHWNKCQNIAQNKLDNWGASLELKMARGAISTYHSSAQLSDEKPEPVRLGFRLFTLVQELPGWSFSAKETNMIAPFLHQRTCCCVGFPVQMCGGMQAWTEPTVCQPVSGQLC